MKRLFSVCAAAPLVLFAAGCGPHYGPGKAQAELSPQEHAGQAVFAARCAGCHLPHSTNALHGPGLFALYRKPYLPSGAPASDDRVAATILRGRGVMPAFGAVLDDEQLTALLAYLHTL